MFSFFFFTGELQHLYGKCFNSQFVIENRMILFVIAYAIAVFRTSDYSNQSRFLEGLNGGPLVGCRLKFTYFVGRRLKFSIFVGCR